MCICSYSLAGELRSVSTIADLLDKGSGAVLLIDGKKVHNFLRRFTKISQARYLIRCNSNWQTSHNKILF